MSKTFDNELYVDVELVTTENIEAVTIETDTITTTGVITSSGGLITDTLQITGGLDTVNPPIYFTGDTRSGFTNAGTSLIDVITNSMINTEFEANAVAPDDANNGFQYEFRNDGTGNSELTDRSGNGFDLTLFGTIPNKDVAINTTDYRQLYESAEFTGNTSNYFRRDISGDTIIKDIFSSTQLTWSCWAYFTSTAGNLYYATDGGGTVRFTLFGSANTIQVIIDSGPSNNIVFTYPFTSNVWQHYVMTCSATGTKFYVNGSLVTPTYLTGTSATAYPSLVNMTTHFIGITSTTNPMIGYIKNMVLVANVWSAGDVTTYYNSQRKGPYNLRSRAITFPQDEYSGVRYSGSNQLSLFTDNINRLTINSTGANFQATDAIYAMTGTVARPSYSFSTDTDTGLYNIGADNLGIATNGVRRLSLSSTGANFNGTDALYAMTGTVAKPSYSFSNDTDTGIYNSSANTLDLATAGVNRLSLTTTEAIFNEPLFAQIGTVVTPSYSFVGDTDTGMYSSTANNLDFTTAGVDKLSISTSALSTAYPVRVGSGSRIIPPLSFTADTDTGFYLNGIARPAITQASNDCWIYQSGVDLTDGVTTQIASIAIPSNTAMMTHIRCNVVVKTATVIQQYCETMVLNLINSNGTVTKTLSSLSSSYQLGSGTLTVSITASATNPCLVEINSNTSLVATYHKAQSHWTINSDDSTVVVSLN